MPKNSRPGPGHNSEPLTDDEVAALEAYYALKINEAQRAADKIKATYDEARGVVTGLFAKAKGDLKVPRKEFQDFIDKQRMTPVEFANWWKKQAARFSRHGLNVGAQQELPLGDTADDKAMAFAMGEQAGLRGDDPDMIPESVATFLQPDFTAGWHEGQTKLAARLLTADGILSARQAAADAAQSAGKLTEDEPEDEVEEDDTDPEVVRKRAKALKDSGWTEPQPEEAEFA